MKNEKLIARRIAKGMSQSGISQKAGLALSTYTYYEHGTRVPSVTNALRIAKVLRCKVEDIFQ